MIPDKLKNMNMFVDGVGYAGKVPELTPPKLTLKTEEYRGGGMDAPVDIDMGMEKLEFDFSLPSLERAIFARFGITDPNGTQVTFRGAYEGPTGVKSCVIKLTGMIKEIDPGGWKPGDEAMYKFAGTATYYLLEIDGAKVIEIDVVNMKRIINGVDQLAAQRAAIGI